MNNNKKDSKIKNIYFLFEVPFTQRDYERFGIELLKKNGFNVVIWELSKIINPNLIKQYSPPDPAKLHNHEIFENKKLASKKITELSEDTFVFNYISYSHKTYWVYRALSKACAEYGVSVTNAFPMPKTKSKKKDFSTYFQRLYNVPRKEILKFLFRFFYRLPFSNIGIKPASLIIAGGKKSLESHVFPTNKNTEILWAHTMDYDLYLKENTKSKDNRPTAVFIDEYVPFHPDYPVSGLKPPMDAETYYPLLNRFFNHLEKDLKIKTVIAASPRSNYEKHPDYFNGRECIRGQTLKLVRESKLVIAHCSTALNYANLYHKPIIFITSEDFEKSWYGDVIRTMSSWYGKEPIFMENDDVIDWNSLMTTDDSCYRYYRNSYIKTDKSENNLHWQIVANRLKKWKTKC